MGIRNKDNIHNKSFSHKLSTKGLDSLLKRIFRSIEEFKVSVYRIVCKLILRKEDGISNFTALQYPTISITLQNVGRIIESADSVTTTSVPSVYEGSHCRIKSGVFRSLGEGIGGVLSVHRLILKFNFDVDFEVACRVFSLLGGYCRLVEKSKQLVCHVDLGSSRCLTFEFNSGGGGLVFLEVSDNPLSPCELVGFAEFCLRLVFKLLIGREVRLSEFKLADSPHLNIDLPNTAMGIEGSRSVVLKDDLGNYSRIYQKYGEVVRVEYAPKSWVGLPLNRVVEALATLYGRGSEAVTISSINEVKEEIRELKTLMNSLVITNDKFNELKGKLDDMLDELKKLKREFRKIIQSMKLKSKDDKSVGCELRFENLEKVLREYLLKLDHLKLIRVRECEIEFGDEFWKGLNSFKGNIDTWLDKWVKDNAPGRWLKNLNILCITRAVVKAIYRHYNRDNPRVSWTLWLKTFEEYLLSHSPPLTLEQVLKELKSVLESGQGSS